MEKEYLEREKHARALENTGRDEQVAKAQAEIEREKERQTEIEREKLVAAERERQAAIEKEKQQQQQQAQTQTLNQAQTQAQPASEKEHQEVVRDHQFAQSERERLERERLERERVERSVLRAERDRSERFGGGANHATASSNTNVAPVVQFPTLPRDGSEPQYIETHVVLPLVSPRQRQQPDVFIPRDKFCTSCGTATLWGKKFCQTCGKRHEAK